MKNLIALISVVVVVGAALASPSVAHAASSEPAYTPTYLCPAEWPTRRFFWQNGANQFEQIYYCSSATSAAIINFSSSTWNLKTKVPVKIEIRSGNAPALLLHQAHPSSPGLMAPGDVVVIGAYYTDLAPYFNRTASLAYTATSRLFDQAISALESRALSLWQGTSAARTAIVACAKAAWSIAKTKFTGSNPLTMTNAQLLAATSDILEKATATSQCANRWFEAERPGSIPRPPGATAAPSSLRSLEVVLEDTSQAMVIVKEADATSGIWVRALSWVLRAAH